MRALRGAAVAALIALSAPAAEAAARVQEIVSPGGIPAWLVEEHAIPMVALEISFVGGAMTDPDEALGAANFLAAMLDEGAGDLDSVAFSTRAQLLAAEFGFSANRDAFSISARMLSDRLDDSIGLLRLALTEPRFDAASMERVRGQIVSRIRSDATNPQAVASEAWFAAAFPDDPYGRRVSGDVESVTAITADDLHAAHARLLTRGGARIGIVGAIDAEAAGRMIDELLGALPEDAPAPGPRVAADAPAGVTVIPLDAPQSTVLFGHAGPMRDDPDFMPLFVANHILGGGGFSSRLTIEVREKRGLAYSAYAYLATFDRAGVIMGGVGTANERVGESLTVIRDEWRRMAEDGVSEEELRKAKQYLTGAYPLRFDSNAKIAGILVGLQREGLGPDYIERRNGLIEAVTLEDVRRVAAAWLWPDQLHVVVVGQPQGLDATQ